MNLFKSFGIGVLSLFLIYILFFNLLMAMNINPFPGFVFPANSVYWNDNYYFGFHSIYAILDGFPRGLSIGMVGKNLANFIESLTGLKETLEKLMNAEGIDIVAIFTFIFNLFIAPLRALVALLAVTIEVFTTIFEIIIYFIQIITGQFNQNNIIDNWNGGNVIWVSGYYDNDLGSYVAGHYEYYDGLVYMGISNGIYVPSYNTGATWVEYSTTPLPDNPFISLINSLLSSLRGDTSVSA